MDENIGCQESGEDYSQQLLNMLVNGSEDYAAIPICEECNLTKTLRL